MIPLTMIVINEFLEGASKVALAERTIRSRHSCLIDRTNRSACDYAQNLDKLKRSSYN
jgi:hypothetical protein